MLNNKPVTSSEFQSRCVVRAVGVAEFIFKLKLSIWIMLTMSHLKCPIFHGIVSSPVINAALLNELRCNIFRKWIINSCSRHYNYNITSSRNVRGVVETDIILRRHESYELRFLENAKCKSLPMRNDADLIHIHIVQNQTKNVGQTFFDNGLCFRKRNYLKHKKKCSFFLLQHIRETLLEKNIVVSTTDN